MTVSMRQIARVVVLCLAFGGVAGLAQAQTSALAQALAQGRAGDWAAAAALVDGAGDVAADLVEWHRLRAGEGSLGDYEQFLTRRADWPGLDVVQARGEVAVARSVTPSRVLRWFGTRAPQTADGAMALERAEPGALRRHWSALRLGDDEQAAVLAAHGTGLTVQDHIARLDNLLWEGRGAEAEAMLPLVPSGWQALARARLGLAANATGLNGLIGAVPPDLADDPGLANARFLWRARNGQDEGALEILRGRAPEALGRAEAWARWRMALARSLWREKGQAQAAYDLVAPHGLTAGATFVDIEFMAGHIALRGLGDPARALVHFHALLGAVSTPISIARGEYWIGRALEAQGALDLAMAAYARASAHQTAYYGLLAAERLGQPLDAALAAPPPLPDWRGTAALRDDRIEAAQLLYEAGLDAQARRFVLALGDVLEAQAQLGAWALARGDMHLAVLIGKQAATRGIILPGVYFPDPGALLPGDLALRPLAMAIARRESEFLPSAVSPAGALGLMQVMPGTASLMARKLGLPDTRAALTTDPGYNARLGVAYLQELQAEFGASLALVAAGYNAGPGRPRRWIEQFGDPRAANTDIVDWVEAVPFAETRTYIMRVLEGAVIYGARHGQGGVVNVSGLLAGR